MENTLYSTGLYIGPLALPNGEFVPAVDYLPTSKGMYVPSCSPYCQQS